MTLPSESHRKFFLRFGQFEISFYLWPITNSVAVSRQLYQKEGFMLPETLTVVSLQPSCNHLVSSSNWHDKKRIGIRLPAPALQNTREDNVLFYKFFTWNKANIPSHFLVHAKEIIVLFMVLKILYYYGFKHKYSLLSVQFRHSYFAVFNYDSRQS